MQEPAMTQEEGTVTDHSFGAVVESVHDDHVVLTLPGKSYQLHLAPPVQHALKPGARVRGIVSGQALRMHAAHGGGKFIEPVWGTPRIVAGVVLESNAARRSVVVDAVATFRLRVPKEQDFAVLQPGTLVNFYIKSGATFEPSA